jgi:hypothetical protein
MKTTTRKARQEGKGRKMILLHEKSGVFNDYTLHPNATEANISKMAADCTNRKAILTLVAVLPLNEQADAARIEAGARIISTDFVDAPHQTERWWKTFKADYPALWKRSERTAHNFLTAIGALSTPGKKGKA